MMTNTAIALSPLRNEPTRVLIVDDNISGAQTLQMILSLEGYQVLVAHTGEEGIELYKEHHPRIVILDIGLPDTSGYSVAGKLRVISSDHQPIIIAMTGWGEERDITRALDSGCDHHLTKPVNFDDLTNVLNHARQNILIETH